MNYKVERIKKVLEANLFVEFAYLFGSRARAMATERSDWDIAIYLKKDPRRLPPWTVFTIEAEISRAIGEEAQVIVLNAIDSPVFLFQVINEGILLIDRNVERRVLFEARVLRNYHDWKFFLKRQMTMK